MDAGCRPAVFGLLGVKPLLAGRVDVDDRDAGRSTGRHADAISLRRSQKQPADLIYLAGRGTESMCAGGRFVRIDRENRDSRLRQLNGFFQCIHGFPPEPLLMDRSLMIASGTGCDCRQPVPAEADRTFWRDDTAVHVQTLKVGEAEAHDDVAPQLRIFPLLEDPDLAGLVDDGVLRVELLDDGVVFRLLRRPVAMLHPDPAGDLVEVLVFDVALTVRVRPPARVNAVEPRADVPIERRQLGGAAVDCDVRGDRLEALAQSQAVDGGG